MATSPSQPCSARRTARRRLGWREHLQNEPSGQQVDGYGQIHRVEDLAPRRLGATPLGLHAAPPMSQGSAWRRNPGLEVVTPSGWWARLLAAMEVVTPFGGMGLAHGGCSRQWRSSSG